MSVIGQEQDCVDSNALGTVPQFRNPTECLGRFRAAHAAGSFA
jgi:hypothetical protein